MIELGDKVKDSVSGFIGIAISRHSYLQGCDRISVQPPFDKKQNKLPENQSFDEPQLIALKKKVNGRKKGPSGGPMRYSDSGKNVSLR